ncbi:MAG TPA: acyl carrier protein [Gammaproteobacteria bacterium]|jgi:acyl carrier protein|nr:acyl carrier protein [Gammaproteobacteria bacterium]
MDFQLSIKTMSTDNTAERIRNIIKQHARLSADAGSLAPSADLYEAGMTSHASVNVMLALEGEFEVEFPDRMLTRGTFDSIASIQNAIEELTSG